MSPVDLALVQAYLSNVQLALHTLDVPCAQSHVGHALELLAQPDAKAPLHLPMQIGVGVGLDAGIQRKCALSPNRCCVVSSPF